MKFDDIKNIIWILIIIWLFARIGIENLFNLGLGI
jgi:hypothetical protein